MRRNSSSVHGGVLNSSRSDKSDNLDLRKQIEILQKKIDAIVEEKNNKDDESHSFSATRSDNNNPSNFQKWIRAFAKNPSVREEFLKNLNQDEIDWVNEYKKCMQSAESLQPQMVPFLQKNLEAFNQKRIALKAGEKREANANEKENQKLKKTITSVMMVTLNY